VTGEHGGMGDVFGNHGLAQAIAADNHPVARLAEEIQGERAFDQGAIDFLRPRPFEVGQGFEAAQAGLSETAFQAAAGEVQGFRTGDFFQQLARAPVLSRGAGQQVIEGFGGAEQTEPS
jgi:hypothetical protein